MRDSFPRGLPGAGSQGDPRLDALLTEEVGELLLDGWPRSAALSPELRPLREAVDALRVAPSAAELGGEPQAMAAFRDLYAADAAGSSGGLAHTLRLPMPQDPGGQRPRRAKHRAQRRTRPAGRGGRPRPSLRRRALGTAAAVVIVAIIGIFAYAGTQPGPIQNSAHAAFGAPAVKTTAPSAPRVEVTGAVRASASSPAISGAKQHRPAITSAPGPTSDAPADGPRDECQAYFKNPWKPGSTSWDKSDFEKLSKVAPGGAAWVLWYCARYLNEPHSLGGTRFFYPAGFPGHSFAWTPGHDQAHDGGPVFPGGVSRPGSTATQATLPGLGDGDPGPGQLPGPGSGGGATSSPATIGGR
jgi:hypothetical protein